MPRKTKHCPHCDRDRLLASFGRNRSRSDGRQAICRECAAREQRERYHRINKTAGESK